MTASALVVVVLASKGIASALVVEVLASKVIASAVMQCACLIWKVMVLASKVMVLALMWLQARVFRWYQQDEFAIPSRRVLFWAPCRVFLEEAQEQG